MGEKISSFRDLRVYQLEFKLQQEIFHVTKQFPRSEQYALTDQFRRASRSIGANIAEAWQKRRYPAHFTSKLTDADGEQAETQHWIDASLACGYIAEEIHASLLDTCQQTGAMLGTMMAMPEKFCHK